MTAAVVAAAVAFGFASVVWLIRRSVLRHAANAPTRVRSDSELLGAVAISGVARGEPTLRSPISGEPVLAYHLIIEEERGPTRWRRVVDRCEAADFWVDDERGSVRVAAGTGQIQLDGRERRGKCGPFRSPPRRVAWLIGQQRTAVYGVLFGKAFRWREQVLLAGESIDVRAHAVQRLAETGASRYRQTPREIVLSGSAGAPIEVVSLAEPKRTAV